jgi:xyloglucan-specific exo-beta-1,4-glucanase
MFVLQGMALAASLLAASTSAISSQSFSWKNVRIGGGRCFNSLEEIQWTDLICRRWRFHSRHCVQSLWKGASLCSCRYRWGIQVERRWYMDTIAWFREWHKLVNGLFISGERDWLIRHDWGIDALATDPVNTEKLYLAVGMYTNSWDPNDGSILRSSDQGTTWAETKLPFKVGGNMPGRGVGEVCLYAPIATTIDFCSVLQ